MFYNGHVQNECPNFLKNKNKKGFAAVWDGDSDDSSDKSDSDNCVALTAKTISPEKSSLVSLSDNDDDYSLYSKDDDDIEESETLQVAYDKLYRESAKIMKRGIKVTSRLKESESENINLKESLESKDRKLDELKRKNEMLRQQFVIVQKERENLENLLNESLSRIEILEKNLGESNEIIKRNDRERICLTC